LAAQTADEAGEAACGAAEAVAEADGEGSGAGIAPADPAKGPLARAPGDDGVVSLVVVQEAADQPAAVTVEGLRAAG
jgi:hypothetical protein